MTLPIIWRYNNLYMCIMEFVKIFKDFLKKEIIPHFFFGSHVNLLLPDLHDEYSLKIKEFKIIRYQEVLPIGLGSARSVPTMTAMPLPRNLAVPALADLAHFWQQFGNDVHVTAV